MKNVAVAEALGNFVTFNEAVSETIPNVKHAKLLRQIRLTVPPKPNVHGNVSREWNSHGFRPLSSRMVWLTPEDCRDILVNHRYPENRGINDMWAKDLSTDLLYVKLDFGYVGKYPVLANGHHSLLAGMNQNRTIPCELTFWECRSEEAFSWLFSTFDSNRKRSFAQIVKVHGSVAKLAPDTPANWWSKVASAAAQAKAGFYKLHSKTNIGRLAVSEDEDVVKFTELIYDLAYEYGVAATARILPNAVVSCLFAAWVSSPGKARAFMKQYLSGEHLATGMPAHSLREKIGNRPAKEHAANSHADFVAYCYSAWRAYRNNEKIYKTALRKMSLANIPAYTAW